MTSPSNTSQGYKRRTDDLESAKMQAKKRRDRVYMILGLIIAALTALFIIVPGINRYMAAVDEMKTINTSIYGDPATGIIGLKDKIEQSLQRLEAIKEKVREENREDLGMIYKIFPLASEERVLTNLVRIFDNISYDWNSPERDQPLKIKNIIFGQPKEEETHTVIPVQMTVTCSKTNFDQLYYFIETSGSMSDIDVFDKELIASLQGIIDPQEEELLQELVESDYTIESLLDFRKLFVNDKVKRRLVDRLIAKPIVYKKYELQAEPRYSPAPLLSVDQFSYQILRDEEDEKIIKEDGEIQLNLKLNAYVQTKDTLSNILQ